MREIKFRAWNVKSSYMYLPDDNNSEMFIYFNGLLCYDGEPVKDNKWILMQFTGLLDKNGKKIFEGDILESITYSCVNDGTVNGLPEKWEYCETRLQGVVEYGEIRADGGNMGHGMGHELLKYIGFYVKGKYRKHENLSSHLRIIGNIYENPELLEAK